MKYDEINFNLGIAAIIEVDGKHFTVAQTNEEGGVCGCCQDFQIKRLDSDKKMTTDHIKVLKVLDIVKMEILYEFKM